MARFLNSQSALIGLFESGTYGSVSGNFYPGLVQDHNIVPSEGRVPYRFIGGGGRNINGFIPGPIMFTGQVNYLPQDFRMLMFALGSNADAGSPSPYSHTMTTMQATSLSPFTSGPLNAFTSFGLEESIVAPGTGMNWVRTIKGCMVDEWVLEGNQGDELKASYTFLGQSGAWQSGTPTALTPFIYGGAAVGSIVDRPYIFGDVNIAIPSGTTFESMTKFKLSYKNNLQERYYLTGSRTPAAPIQNPTTIMLDVEFDAMSERAKTLYENYYVGGSQFNAILSVKESASRDNTFVASGCSIMDPFDSPMGLTGPFPNNVTIQITSLSPTCNDPVMLYNPW